MKKITTLLFVLVLPLFSLAQRHADIELTMISPEDGLEILEGQSFSYNVVIKNNGPDTIVAADSINIQYILDNYAFDVVNGSQMDSVVRYTQLHLFPGDSFSIMTPPVFTNVLRNHEWCWNAILVNRFLDPITDPNVNNNKDCSNVYITPTSVNSVVNQAVTRVYPIPAKDVLNWETGSSKPQQISMFDMTGRVVYKAKPITSKGQINVSEFVKGLYFIQIAGEGDGSFSQKVMIE